MKSKLNIIIALIGLALAMLACTDANTVITNHLFN